MASGRRAPLGGRPRRPASGGTKGSGGAKASGGGKKKAQRPAPQRSAAPASVPAPEPRTFRLGVIPGATPGKWIDIWKQRMPQVTLELVPVEVRAQRAALDELDAVIVRLPLADDALHIIPLYDEVPVVVASAESHLLAADALGTDDLGGEVLITPLDDVLGDLAIPGVVAPSFSPLETTADAIATAASGTGIVIVPMSLARAHQRKDAGYRPWRDGPTSTVALAWPRERTTADVEAFVGVVRGRTANSSR